MRFTSPLLLTLLVLLPLIAFLGWPARGFARRRELVSLVLRLIILLCLIFSLAGLELLRASDALSVVFLIDASDSMPDLAQAAAADYARRAIENMGPDDQAAVIVFGGDALVERPMSPARELGTLASIPNTGQTDLSEAIRLALALYPPGAARRMVILSDGAATTGDAQAAARLASASGVEIVAAPFVTQPGAEVALTEVEVPARLRQDERFDLRLSVRATQPMRAEVRILIGGQVAYAGTHDLERGAQSFTIPLTAGAPGFVRYVVQLNPEADGYYQNNELAAFSQVEGPPQVLLVAPPAGEPFTFEGTPRPDEFSQLSSALQAAGFVVEVARPSGLPSEVVGLADYASVVLVDVPARDLSRRQMLAVQSYVRDLGGGLAAVGGPTSYGVGGYFRTPLEEVLPVEMQIKDEQRRPSLAIVFVIDRSGSMAETSGGVAKLELATEAAARSVELLSPSDRVGVVAFDEVASWVVPIIDLSDPNPVLDAIGSIRSGGGTDILAGLQAMASELPSDSASLKHVILLTDGGADPTGIPELVQRLNVESGVTLTAVGVGRDAAPFLQQLAELGGGRYHFTADPAAIPSIFTEETTLATRSYIVEETFFPQQVSASPILSGITEVPALQGYVGTTAKDAAQTILVSEQQDPILATWQYGLGRAVAFTSDASGRWARQWIGWEGFPIFWAQAVRSTIGDRARSALDVQVEQAGENARLIVDAQTETGAYLNRYTLQANVVAPDGQVEAVSLRQVAPGRYEAPFTPNAQGAYLIGVAGQAEGGNGQTVAETAGWVLSYSPEYRELESDPDALYRIALSGGGRIASADPAAAFAHTLPAPYATQPIWPPLLLAAALLLPVDIAVRRLTIGWGDVRRAWLKLIERVRFGQPAPAAPARSHRMDALLQAKQRAGKPAVQTPPETPVVPEPMSVPPESATSEKQSPLAPKPTAPSSPEATAAALLARKKSKAKEQVKKR
ncbi:MAG TPA: VWA domain-containing protein [Anaerolineae bacterium]|nr:VWA domain-containing protein [Anaerolineae bacterium]